MTGQLPKSEAKTSHVSGAKVKSKNTCKIKNISDMVAVFVHFSSSTQRKIWQHLHLGYWEEMETRHVLCCYIS